MWKRSDVLEGKRYFVALVQEPSGRRSYELCELGETPRSPQVVLATNEVPWELLKRGDLLGIAEHVTLNDGRPYSTEAHGVWFTPEEGEAWNKGEEVPWLNGLPPLLPPR